MNKFVFINNNDTKIFSNLYHGAMIFPPILTIIGIGKSLVFIQNHIINYLGSFVLYFNLKLSQISWWKLLTPKGQMSMWRPKKTSGHAIVNVIFT
jgi:hypothetical protein